MNDREMRIRERAYEIWESEGRPLGKGPEHWEKATRELGLEANPPKDGDVSSNIQLRQPAENVLDQRQQQIDPAGKARRDLNNGGAVGNMKQPGRINEVDAGHADGRDKTRDINSSED